MTDSGAATLELSALAVTLVISGFLPLLVGLITKYSASSGLKAVVLITVQTVQTLVVAATLNDGTAVFSAETLIMGALGWVTAVATYFGAWKPVGAPEHLAPHTGLG